MTRGGWTPRITPQNIPAVIKLARLMVVQEAYEKKEEAMKALQERMNTQGQEISEEDCRAEDDKLLPFDRQYGQEIL